MGEDKATFELPPVLHLPLVKRGQIHPYAGQQYWEFLLQVLKEVPRLYLLSDEDLQVFLFDQERAKFEASVDEIKDWLEKCNKNYYHSPFDAMWDLKKLIKKVAERKLLSERRLAALEATNPPFDDAKQYLTPQECRRFLDNLPGAADAYLDGGKGCILNDWRFDRRASSYIGLTGIIKERKEKEARRKQAELEHNQSKKEINEAIKKFKLDLAKEKKPKFAYSPALVEYHPDLWCELEQPTKEEVEKWAEQYIWERVPQPLKNFVSWELSWQVKILPNAGYEALGIPCLTWYFRILIFVEVLLRLIEKKVTQKFQGYAYEIVVHAQNLGSFYLGPVEWDHQEGFTTPIALLSMLAKGKLEEDGIQVMEHDGSSISFFIRGYDEAFTKINEEFRQFVMNVTKDKTLAQGLLANGMIDGVTAQLVEEKAKLPLPHLVGAQASAGESTVDNSDVEAALEVLGYKKKEIKAGIEAAHLSPGMSFEEKLKAVLKNTGA